MHRLAIGGFKGERLRPKIFYLNYWVCPCSTPSSASHLYLAKKAARRIQRTIPLPSPSISPSACHCLWLDEGFMGHMREGLTWKIVEMEIPHGKKDWFLSADENFQAAMSLKCGRSYPGTNQWNRIQDGYPFWYKLKFGSKNNNSP